MEDTASSALLVRIAAYDQASAWLALGMVQKAGAVLGRLGAAYGDALDHALAGAASAVRIAELGGRRARRRSSPTVCR
jgi:hypothetical protein